jgi:adenylosuccinate synthase
VPGTCVIGLQWGDEAKGKLVDLLTSRFEIVVRYQGGANAGHTVVVGDKTYKLHHVPSGILTPGVLNVVTPGVVINPPTILKELDSLAAQGISVGRNLVLSDRAHVVFPWHIAEDKVLDQATGGENIGTTLRGIGPCYRDKVGRSHAIRLGDLYRPDFATRVAHIVAAKNKLLVGLGSEQEALDAQAIVSEYTGYAARLHPFVGDTTHLLLDAVEAGKRLLFEGAQGSLLDIDHGTFPYVTSSNASGVGVSAGSGVPGKWIGKVIGVAKAYSTRVGGGPFPTELENEMGQRIRELGREYGTTTGRPRRCGWFDAVAVRYTARLSGIDCISLMMMDVLSQLPEVKICVAYDLDGERIDRFPGHADDLRRCKPVYESFPGWQTDVTKVRKIADLPAGARAYLERVTQLVGKPVEIVSVGPDRAQTMFSGSMAS